MVRSRHSPLTGQSWCACQGPNGLTLLGFSKIAPPPFEVPVVLSQQDFRRGPAFGTRMLRLVRGPSLSFLTTSTVCSNRLPAGLLHPADGHGVHHVSGRLVGRLNTARCRAASRLPSTLAIPVACNPSKLSPRQKLCVASPRPIPSRRCRRCRLSVSACRHAEPGRRHAPARPQGLVPLPSPLLPPGVATWKPLVAPLGLFPTSGVAHVGLCSEPESRVQGSPRVTGDRACCAGPWSPP